MRKIWKKSLDALLNWNDKLENSRRRLWCSRMSCRPSLLSSSCQSSISRKNWILLQVARLSIEAMMLAFPRFNSIQFLGRSCQGSIPPKASKASFKAKTAKMNSKIKKSHNILKTKKYIAKETASLEGL